MKEIGLFEAKTNLSKIAEAVNRTGQAVIITRRGLPYVDLVPHRPATTGRRTQDEVLADLEQLSGDLRKEGFEQIRADVAEGRR